MTHTYRRHESPILRYTLINYESNVLIHVKLHVNVEHLADALVVRVQVPTGEVFLLVEHIIGVNLAHVSDLQILLEIHCAGGLECRVNW